MAGSLGFQDNLEVASMTAPMESQTTADELPASLGSGGRRRAKTRMAPFMSTSALCRRLRSAASFTYRSCKTPWCRPLTTLILACHKSYFNLQQWPGDASEIRPPEQGFCSSRAINRFVHLIRSGHVIKASGCLDVPCAKFTSLNF